MWAGSALFGILFGCLMAAHYEFRKKMHSLPDWDSLKVNAE